MSTKQVLMTVGGMISSDDTDTLEHTLKQVHGVVCVEIDDRGNVTLTVADTLEGKTIRSAVEELGFTANIQ